MMAQAMHKRRASMPRLLPSFQTGSGAAAAAITLFFCAGFAMAAMLENLRWKPDGTQVHSMEDQNTEGKFGVPRFDGNPHTLQEYEWRVRTKMAKEAEMSKDETAKLGPLGLRLVEGLRGPALRLAQQVDISVLSSSAGPTTLLKTLNSNLKPRKEQQARELYSAGSKEGGMLARQHGEPMSSYVARRTAWWNALQSLDQELKVPDVLLAEMTLTNSGLSEDQRLMIRTVLQGRITTDLVTTELLSQHPSMNVNDELESRRAIPKAGDFNRVTRVETEVFSRRISILATMTGNADRSR